MARAIVVLFVMRIVSHAVSYSISFFVALANIGASSLDQRRRDARGLILGLYKHLPQFSHKRGSVAFEHVVNGDQHVLRIDSLLVNEGADVVDEDFVFEAGKELNKFGGGPVFDLFSIDATQVNLLLENLRKLHRLLPLSHVLEPSRILVDARTL